MQKSADCILHEVKSAGVAYDHELSKYKARYVEFRVSEFQLPRTSVGFVVGCGKIFSENFRFYSTNAL